MRHLKIAMSDTEDDAVPKGDPTSEVDLITKYVTYIQLNSLQFSSLNVFDLLESLPTEKIEAMLKQEMKPGQLIPETTRLILKVFNACTS